MTKITAIPVPQGSLLAEFGPPPDSTTQPYRDCFVRRETDAVTLEQFVERFYCSWAFRPERLALGLIGRGASSADARRLARGETENFAAWTVIDRRSASDFLAEHGPEGSASPTGRPQARKGRGNRTPDGVRNTKNAEILLQDFQGATASWLSVRPSADGGTELLFGSWVGKPDRGVVKALMPFHRLYARVLLGGA